MDIYQLLILTHREPQGSYSLKHFKKVEMFQSIKFCQF